MVGRNSELKSEDFCYVAFAVFLLQPKDVASVCELPAGKFTILIFLRYETLTVCCYMNVKTFCFITTCKAHRS